MNRFWRILKYLSRVARLLESTRAHVEGAKDDFEEAFAIVTEIAKTDERAAKAKAHMESGFAQLHELRKVRDEAFPRRQT